MSFEDKVKPDSPWGCSGGGGAGVAAARAAVNSESDAAFSSWAERKASSACFRVSLHFCTFASAFLCFAIAESSLAPGWRGSLRSLRNCSTGLCFVGCSVAFHCFFLSWKWCFY